MKKQILAVACGMCLAMGSAVVADAQIAVRIGPPPRHHEIVPPPPRFHRDWVWQPGYNRWDGHHYIWVGGTYVAPPRPHARWVPGHWDHRRGGYFWVEGHWV